MEVLRTTATRVSASPRVDLERAVEAHYSALVRRLAMVVGDPHEAQDLAQSAFMRALEAWDTFDGRDVRGWLYTIGLRLAFNETRRRRRWRDFLGQARPSESYLEADPDLWLALGALEQRTRAAILLSVLDGYTYQEIGAMLDAPAGTVGSWIARGKAHLRTVLKEDLA